jgi:hypothetical protein
MRVARLEVLMRRNFVVEAWTFLCVKTRSTSLAGEVKTYQLVIIIATKRNWLYYQSHSPAASALRHVSYSAYDFLFSFSRYQ